MTKNFQIKRVLIRFKLLTHLTLRENLFSLNALIHLQPSKLRLRVFIRKIQLYIYKMHVSRLFAECVTLRTILPRACNVPPVTIFFSEQN